jgi:Ran GTPase-activating protein (RanGAP) involved in mRNA processing and transport
VSLRKLLAEQAADGVLQATLERLENAEKVRDDLYEVARRENERKDEVARRENERKDEVARRENERKDEERKVDRLDDALNKWEAAVKEGAPKG